MNDAQWATTGRELAKQLMLWARERDSPQGIAAQKDVARIKTQMCADLRAEMASAAAQPPPEVVS
jgi:hypothetical protein